LAPSAADQRLVRRAVTLIDRPRRKTAAPFLPAGRKIYVSRDQTGLCDALCPALSGAGLSAEAFSLSEALPDFSDAGGLLILADPRPENPAALLKSALLAASKAAGALAASAAAGAGLFGAVTRLDGALGFGGRSDSDPLPGGLFGLVKCAAIEWPTVACRALDVDPSWSDLDAVAAEVIEELFCAEENVETGLGKDSRRVPELHQAPPAAGAAKTPDLSPEDVVLITGGARGVTAEAAVALARSAAPTLVLLGRSAAPEPEPAWLRGISTEADVKKAVLENLFSGGRPSPAQLEEAYRKIAAGREISRNLARMEEAGARVRYFSADIRNETMLDSVLEEVRTFYGPVSALIHGAGVLDDRLIVDKTGEQFDRVFSTKVDGLLSVLSATGKDPVRSIILFSSVAARFGNRGQADYAMANEVLNKIAAKEARTRAGCRVCATSRYSDSCLARRLPPRCASSW
jgi:NAD(P)-dependent dehydrogenase (short-subunit alcohol dehydrogenase family)